MASRSPASADRPGAALPGVGPSSSRWRAYGRIAGLGILFLACLPPHLVARRGGRLSPWPRRFLRGAARIAGLRVAVEGHPLAPHSLLLANHSSWLDILVLGGATGTRFVSKAEVERVPLIGWLADQNRTLYIERAARADAHAQVGAIAAALDQPQPLAIFPEGTTGDGRTLLPFRPTLLHAVAPPPRDAEVRAVAIDYGDAVDALAWHGGEPGLANALRVLGFAGTRAVTVRLLDPLPPHDDRKALGRAARAAIAAALTSVGAGDALEAPTT
jgi:1-acyl-sn-glycerol-3-phosphate acyltransferase